MTSENFLAILPLGATEQHGTHLPFETDTLIAEGVVDRLKLALPNREDITFLPVEKIGYSPEHLDYPGSLSLSYDEAISRWIGIGEALQANGIRKLIMLNAHGGNSPLMTIVATELRVRFSMLAVATSWTRFGTPNGMISKEEIALGIHGGDIETSVMLALHAELVQLERARNFTNAQSQLAAKNEHLRAYGRHAFGWKMQDLNPIGVVGNAKAATAEKGEKLLAHSVSGLLKLIEEAVDFDMNEIDKADNFTEKNGVENAK